MMSRKGVWLLDVSSFLAWTMSLDDALRLISKGYVGEVPEPRAWCLGLFAPQTPRPTLIALDESKC